jgi:uncharacterized membrane protein (Fun14 family)
MATDLAPFAGTVEEVLIFITAYAIKEVLHLGAVIVGLFIAALAYLQYHQIPNVDWERIQVFSQTGITWVAGAFTQMSGNIRASHSGTLSPGNFHNYRGGI